VYGKFQDRQEEDGSGRLSLSKLRSMWLRDGSYQGTTSVVRTPPEEKRLSFSL